MNLESTPSLVSTPTVMRKCHGVLRIEEPRYSRYARTALCWAHSQLPRAEPALEARRPPGRRGPNGRMVWTIEPSAPFSLQRVSPHCAAVRVPPTSRACHSPHALWPMITPAHFPRTASLTHSRPPLRLKIRGHTSDTASDAGSALPIRGSRLSRLHQRGTSGWAGETTWALTGPCGEGSSPNRQ